VKGERGEEKEKGREREGNGGEGILTPSPDIVPAPLKSEQTILNCAKFTETPFGVHYWEISFPTHRKRSPEVPELCKFHFPGIKEVICILQCIHQYQ